MARARDKLFEYSQKQRKMTEYQIVKDGVPFNSHIDTYTLLNDAYTGNGGFKDGTYLAPHPREPSDKYVRRCYLSYYSNYVKPCVNAHVDPIFKEYPVREYKANALVDAFLNNVDGRGTKIDRFIKRAAIRAKLFGAMFAVVDNATGADNLQDALERRLYPYVYLVTPKQIVDWAVDRFGELSMFKYMMAYSEIVDGHKRQKNVTWTWTQDRWVRADDKGTSEGVNEIGAIPVVPLLGALNEDGEILPVSEFYSIARANLAIFNACSELRERNRNQAFSLLTYQLGDDDDYEQAQEITVGTTDILLYSNTATNKPEYATPSAEPSQMLLDEIKTIVQEIYRMAERANVTGVQEQTSGVAKEWDNQSINQTIAEFAKNVEEFEEQIARIFGLYINADLDYKATYSNNFGIVDVAAELSKVTQALGLTIGGKFDKEVKKIAARTMLHDQDDNIVNAVIEDIEQQDDLYVKSEDGDGETG